MTAIAESRIWVTGASSGIGEALAYELAKRGARLVLSARKASTLEVVRARCDRPNAHDVVPFDLADPASITAAAQRALGIGAVDVVVHNGGLSQRSLVRDTAMDVDRRLMETNYFGTVALTRAVLPAMLDRGRGHFVVISSVLGKIGTPYRSSYAASKHALHGFFDSMRAEVAASGIKVGIVCPGFVRTDVSKNALTGDGSPQGTTDEATARGMSPAKCARRIAAAIADDESEVLVGGKEIATVYAKRFAPRLLEAIVARAKVR